MSSDEQRDSKTTPKPGLRRRSFLLRLGAVITAAVYDATVVRAGELPVAIEDLINFQVHLPTA